MRRHSVGAGFMNVSSNWRGGLRWWWEIFKLLTVQCFLSLSFTEQWKVWVITCLQLRSPCAVWVVTFTVWMFVILEGRVASLHNLHLLQCFFFVWMWAEGQRRRWMEERTNRGLHIVPLDTQKSLWFFSDREPTHWSWSSDRSSLWSERRGRHWIQHWRGYCHL